MKCFSYKNNQPNNLDAWKIGEACRNAANASSGDYIDTGLALLRELEAEGFVLSTKKESI